MENCVRCKAKRGLLVPLIPVSSKTWKDKGKEVTNKKYVCTCGCSFERTMQTAPGDGKYKYEKPPAE
jgi:hypothetical protein